MVERLESQLELQEMHPSLMQYAALFPPTNVPSTNFTGHLASNFEPQSLDQSTAGVSDFTPASWNSQIPSHPNTEIHSPAVSGSFANDPNSYNLFEQLYQETPATTLDTWGSNDMTDLGQMMSIDCDMDEQWMSFMKESGIVNSTTFSA
ncbi:hypothetical protein FIBSPDRAFT_966748 [Athelia psychrophila]|uniref:Uncharacterized protein n=1 Tax=Athelia psychrophila TaxID=1759441 RepID=A0A167WG63_9AGAM|nr:hypothetical protein FIBSPDRAFT_966748 [Fibularhizoctonia sp. CBS 109695]